jgi:hypothetical protein
MMNSNPGLAAFVAIAINLVGAASASAEMQILESNVPEFRIGSRMTAAGDIVLPAGGRVKVLLLRSNETRVFMGPSAAQPVLRNIPFGGTRGIPAPTKPAN